MSEVLLEPLGFGRTESELYVLLLSAPRSTAARLAEALGTSPGRLRPALVRLVDAGLVARMAGSPVRFIAAPPEAAVDSLTTRRQAELDRLRVEVRDLALRYQGAGAGSPVDLVELVEGPDALRERVEQMQFGAKEELQFIDCPPYFSDTAANPIEMQLLRHGVTCRAIYHAPALEGRMEFVQECIDAGEQARSLPSVRMKMVIADRRSAMIPLNFEATDSSAGLFVRPSPLLTALVTCFDLLWERATPLTVGSEAGGPAGLDGTDRKLLTMLAAGMKDAAVTRALGITQRTMTRRVAHLMDLLDAQTRFQAGIQAAKRGWL